MLRFALSVKTPWQWLRGVVQEGLECRAVLPRRSGAGRYENPGAGPDERRTVNSAHVLSPCNGAAADQKTAPIVIRLGELHRKRPDARDTLGRCDRIHQVMVTTESLSKLAASGDADAQFRLGYRFAFCKDKRRRNLERAFSMWKAAAEQGHLRARFYLGTCYDFGSGTRRNLTRAMFWYHQAAVANDDVAQYNLALGYRDGLGVPRSQRMAVKWLRVAAAAGNPEAQNDLGYCLHEGLGVRKDRRHAFRCYFQAAKHGVLRAQFNIGLCYRDGDGVKASNQQAREWLRKAARRGHAQARDVLAAIAPPVRPTQARR